ncbi:MAG: hypothetical protein VYC12_00470 [Candidatus Thermoplasmatota archaeon]|nr:hypothetical protein [Candidatus Thermoplasmatota archaeon]
MADTESKGRDIDLKYVFGTLILWAGVGIIGLIFVSLFNGSTVYFLGYIFPVVLIPLGIYLMKTSRSATSVGESYTAGMVYRSFRP